MPGKVVESYQQTWCAINAKPIPDGTISNQTTILGNPVVEREFALLQHQVDDYGKVRLLAAVSKYSAD